MSEPSAPDEEIPWLSSSRLVELIGRFTIERQLGAGGDGTVFCCLDTALGRRVAIKLQGAEVQDPVRRDRFAREARALATVRSPYVVTIYEVGQERGYPFLVMEFLEGDDLETIRQRGPVRIEDAVRYMGQVAEGLSHIHAAGIVHRDVKPANIIIEGDRAVLVDLGLATPVDGSERITSHDLIPGTAAFMAPEQMRGQVDPRSDIFALGSTLYSLLAPTPPFLRASAVETIAATLNEPAIPLVDVVDGVPRALSDLVDRLLAKVPSLRPSSMSEVASALEQILRDLGGPAIDEEKASAIQGSLRHMTLPELLQSLELGGKTAKIALQLDEGGTLIPATIVVENGQVVNAVMPGLRGPEAFYRMAAATDGRFTVHYDVEVGARNVDEPTAGLLLEAFRRLDEARRNASSPPTTAGAAEASGPAPSAGVSPASSSEALDAEGRAVFEGPAEAAVTTDEWGFLEDDVPVSARGDTPIGDDVGERAAARPLVEDAEWTTEPPEFERLPTSGFEEGLTNTRDAIRRLRWRISPARRLALLIVVLSLAAGAGLTLRERYLRDPLEVARERLARGEAAALLTDLEATPKDKRPAFADLMRGHAHAALEHEEEAIGAYHEAAVAGVVDGAAFEYLRARLDNAEAKAVMDALVVWPDPSIADALAPMVVDGEWWARHQAWRVLEKRKQDERVDVTELGILDLRTGPTCNKRRYGLQILTERGAGERALAEVRALRHMEGIPCIVERDIARAEEEIEVRNIAARAASRADAER